MRRNIIIEFFITVRLYFFTILFFIEGCWLRIRKKDVKIIVLLPEEGDWLEESEAKVTPKPSQADAITNKAKFGLSQIPKEHRWKAIIGIGLSIFFFLFGIVDFIIRLTALINAYPIVGWILLDLLCAFILFRITRGIYKYFADYKIIPEIKIIWDEAKNKAELKFKIKSF